MHAILLVVRLLELIALTASFCFASSPASVVEAFHFSSTTTTTKLHPNYPHLINRSRELPLLSPTKPLLSKTAEMTAASLKGTASDEDASPSLSSPSVLDDVLTKIGSTTSMVVAGTFFIVLCYKRDAIMVSFFLGAISNAILGKVLKKILKIERPEVSLAEIKSDQNSKALMVPAIDQPSDNGMPSSHAMSLGFICTFVALLLPSTTIPLIAYAAISLIYRVRVNLHSVDQIAVGAVLGTFNGAAWWYSCTKGFHGLNLVELVSSSGMLNESGQLHWYLLAVPLLVGAAVVGSVERRLGKYFRSDQKQD